MPRVILIIAVIALAIYAVVEIAQADSYRVRYLPKWMWFVIAVVGLGIGPIAWLLFGRPQAEDTRPPGRGAPDDDPDFLRGL